MNDINQLQSMGNDVELGVSETSTQYLQEVSKWARILALISFSFILLYFIFGLLSVFTSQSPAASFFLFLALSIPLVLILIPLSYLYKFSENLKIGIENNSLAYYTEAFRFFRSYYKYIGIFTLIVLILYFFAFSIMIAGFFASGTN